MAQVLSRTDSSLFVGEVQSILRALAKVAYEEDRCRIPPPMRQACAWIFNELEYQQWRDEQKSSFLWISGPEGSGKSVLSAYLADELRREESQLLLPSTVCYFFFNSNTRENGSPSSSLCAILHQLFTRHQEIHNPRLIHHAVNEYRAQGQAFTNQASVLWRILSSVVADPDCGNVILIMDGLSECDEADRISFINSMARFYTDYEEERSKSGGYLKIIMTTRFALDEAVKRLEKTKMRFLTLSSRNLSSSIELYVTTRVQTIIPSSNILTTHLQRKITDYLLARHNGSFLWLSLALGWLETFAFEFVTGQSEIDLSPLDGESDRVNKTYEMSLARCPEPAITRRLLQIIVAVAEPLTLEELNIAMLTECSSDIRDKIHNIIIDQKFVMCHCGVFVRIVHSKVVFVHQTARVFLIEQSQKTSVQESSIVNLVDANALLAEICVSYLKSPGFGTSPLGILHDEVDGDVELKIQNYTSSYVFLEYASKHWAEHFRYAREPGKLLDSVRALCDLTPRFWTWFQIYWFRTFSLSLPPRNITRIMVAAHFGNLKLVEQAAKAATGENPGDDVTASDEHGRTALHWATQSGNLEVVEWLLNNGARADAKTNDKHQSTALDLAAARGFESIVQLFLKKETLPSDPSMVDLRAPKKGRPDLMLGAPLKRRSSKIIYSNVVGRARSVMLAEAAQVGNEDVVNRLLDQGTSSNHLNSRGLTALHLAAINNHLPIVRLLLEKGRAEIDRRSAEGMTALAIASAKGHKQIVEFLLTRGANTGSYDTRGKTLFSSADKSIKELLERPPIVKGPSLSPRPRSPPPLIPNVFKRKEDSHPSHDFLAIILDFWFLNTNEERSQFATPTIHNLLYGDGPKKIMAPLRQRDVPKTPTIRWLHLPSNNMIWVKHLIERIYYERIGDSEPSRQSYFEAKLKRMNKLFDVGQQYRAPKDSAVHARFFRPSCRSVSINAERIIPRDIPTNPRNYTRQSSEDKTSKDNVEESFSKDNEIVLFMPFLHYETNAGRKKMTKAIENAKEREMDDEGLGNGQKLCADERLIRTYLHEKPSMHVRRTLDQYYYHTMKDTSFRDEDQVVFRYAKKMWPEKDESEHNILMVDQLWLWVLDGDTVITSFPQRWDRKQSQDDLDVAESIRKHIQLREGRDPLRSAYDLVVLIASFCSELFFEREDTVDQLDEGLQFLEFFDKSIGDVTASETACFDRLARFFRDLETKSREKEGYFIEAMEKEAEDDELDNDPLLNTEKPYDAFYHIGEEAGLLREIKDIRDELNIITKIYTDQHKVLEMLNKLIKQKVSLQGKDSSSEILRRIKRHMDDIKEIDDHASRTYEALNHLLDLKQKHANVCEARWTREQAQVTARQSNTIMIFTIVTIIFLPLSFMASFFALQIVEFPKDPSNGNLALELSYVSKYIFGISAGIIAPFLLIAFNVNRITLWVKNKSEFLLETPQGMWMLACLGRLPPHRKALLLRKRENRMKRRNQSKQEEQQMTADMSTEFDGDQTVREKETPTNIYGFKSRVGSDGILGVTNGTSIKDQMNRQQRLRRPATYPDPLRQRNLRAWGPDK